MASAIAILVFFSFLSFPAVGQDEPVPDEFPESAGAAGEITGSDGIPGTMVLPEGIETQEAFMQPVEETQTLGPSVADYVRVLAGLLIVIGLIWGISLLLKKFVTVRGLAGSSNNLKVLTSLSLTPTRTLYMVRLGDRILLLGSGEGGLRTLAEITDPEEVSDLLREFEYKGNFDLNPFREHLKSSMDKDGGDAFDSDKDLNVRQRKLKGILDRLKDGEE